MDPVSNFVWCWRETKLHAVNRVSSRTLCGYYAFIDDSWRPCPEIPAQVDYCGACSKAVSSPARPARFEMAQVLFDLASQLDHALHVAPGAVKAKVLTQDELCEWMDKLTGSIEFFKRDVDGLRHDLGAFYTDEAGR